MPQIFHDLVRQIRCTVVADMVQHVIASHFVSVFYQLEQALCNSFVRELLIYEQFVNT